MTHVSAMRRAKLRRKYLAKGNAELDQLEFMDLNTCTSNQGSNQKRILSRSKLPSRPRPSANVVLSGAQLNQGTKYYMLWDYQGETGKDCWKFRGGNGFAAAICDMEDSMADDPNIGMPGNLLQMAASDWAQSFYDMAANYEAYGEPAPSIFYKGTF
ncbi:hypothetical protein FB451DRAFT_1175924 [Mycena latifolia]|nr:hypothetical protein FB451DRAFT_1175924 [Mycena latifolia]